MQTLKQSSSLIKLVAMLNDGKYHDGTTIGDRLHITRSAVWKAIEKLRTYGILIHSSKGKGYMLAEPLILLNKSAIKKDKAIALDIFERLDSTNEYLKKFFSSHTPRICLAEQMTQGKGRLQRNWHAPFGLNIYFSCLYPFQKDISELTGLSLIISLAVVTTLNTYHLPQSLWVKWPNDVIYDNKKFSGTLIEMQAETHGTCCAIIGTGINVNMSSDKKHAISQPWISLADITGNYIDRNVLVALLIKNMFDYLKRFEKQGLSAFTEEWNTVDCLFNRHITLKSGNAKIAGLAKGINQHGHLLLALKSGEVRAFSSGDTTLMK